MAPDLFIDIGPQDVKPSSIPLVRLFVLRFFLLRHYGLNGVLLAVWGLLVRRLLFVGALVSDWRI
jgi:hypothetical protein